MKKITLGLLILFILAELSYARTLLLDGDLNSKIELNQTITFKPKQNILTLIYRFALPTNYSTPITVQEIENLNVDFSVKPAKIEEQKDKEGNTFKTVYFENISKDIEVKINFLVKKKHTLKVIEFTDEYPVKNLTGINEKYLSKSSMVQSEEPEIKELARRIAGSSQLLFDVVNRVVNYVTDNVKYTYNPEKYDAIFTLKTKTGNCQNIAHLSIALLRALKIPARIVGGITLKEHWKIPLGKEGYLVQSMGQGGHAWIEVYFPSLGWLPYDPQQSKNFVSTRHIKQTHGIDSTEINDSWRASPSLPSYEEEISARYIDDKIDITLSGSEPVPGSYLVSNSYKGIVTKPEPIEEKKPEERREKLFSFGNTNFPNLVNLYSIKDDKGLRILDKETAEYVSSQDIYAQRFEVNDKLRVLEISLALHKFGGDGAIYLDLVEDENRRPSLKGVRSEIKFLKDVEKRQGYYWVNFEFDKDTVLEKKKYWIVFRKSGEAIINWFYIPGNPYGDSDDTRSTKRGWDWNDLLNYDFVFKVKAERL